MNKKFSDLSDEEVQARREAALDMENITQAEAASDAWTYTCNVSPVYLSDDNADFRVVLNGLSNNKDFFEQKTRFTVFDMATVRLYHKMFSELIRKFDNGEIKNPW